jgi:hypothetical protein
MRDGSVLLVVSLLCAVRKTKPLRGRRVGGELEANRKSSGFLDFTVYYFTLPCYHFSRPILSSRLQRLQEGDDQVTKGVTGYRALWPLQITFVN